MILRIYWTDKLQRQRAGYQTSTLGLRARIAKRFNTSEEIVKKIAGMKHRSSKKVRRRFPSIKLDTLKIGVKRRVAHRDRGYR